MARIWANKKILLVVLLLVGAVLLAGAVLFVFKNDEPTQLSEEQIQTLVDQGITANENKLEQAGSNINSVADAEKLPVSDENLEVIYLRALSLSKNDNFDLALGLFDYVASMDNPSIFVSRSAKSCVVLAEKVNSGDYKQKCRELANTIAHREGHLAEADGLPEEYFFPEER